MQKQKENKSWVGTDNYHMPNMLNCYYCIVFNSSSATVIKNINGEFYSWNTSSYRSQLLSNYQKSFAFAFDRLT